MPECIVCKGYYEAGQRCERCDWDNAPWDDWQATRTEEQGGVEGLLAFSAPHLYLPFFMTVLAVAFGLMGIGGLWKGLAPAAQLLAMAVTVCGCLIAALAGHDARHNIREQELLNRVRRGYSALLGSVQLRAIILPAFSLFLVLLIAYSMVTSDLLWKLARWLLLDPAYLEEIERQEAVSDMILEGEQPEETEGLRKRLRQVFPFTLMGMYVAFMLSFTYSSSLMLALVYAQEMNKALPQPIFLQDCLLASIVRREAELLLGRLSPEETNVSLMRYVQFRGAGDSQLLLPSVAGGGPLSPELELWGQSATWVWDELARTDNGGIEMKVARQEIYQLPRPTEKPGHRPHPRVGYTVHADPWGRITEIKRDEKKAKQGDS